MNQTINEVEVNGVKYVRKDLADTALAPQTDGLSPVLIRTLSAGVHFGFLKSRNGQEVELVNTRRVFYWDGAASLSQMATEGVKEPKNCKFSVVVPTITLLQAIEVIPLSASAVKNLYEVPVWKR